MSESRPDDETIIKTAVKEFVRKSNKGEKEPSPATEVVLNNLNPNDGHEPENVAMIRAAIRENKN